MFVDGLLTICAYIELFNVLKVVLRIFVRGSYPLLRLFVRGSYSFLGLLLRCAFPFLFKVFFKVSDVLCSSVQFI